MKYPGVYRGYVVSNDDTKETDQTPLGRVKVNVPQIYGENPDVKGLPWAWPCVSFLGGGLAGTDGKQTSGVLCVPPVGATVWILFEEGDIQSPVYIGTWWGKKEEMITYSGSSDYPDVFVFKTPWNSNAVLRIIKDKLLELTYDDMSILMESKGDDPSRLTISSAGGDILVEAENGKITLRADEIELDSTHDTNIFVGHYRFDPQAGQVVDTEGDLQVIVTKDTYLSTYHKGIITTSKDGGFFMHSPNVSGFEEHGGKL